MHTVIPPAGSGGRASSNSAIEIRADQIVHWIGITTAPIAVGLLIGVLLREHPAGRLWPSLIYGCGLLAMLGCSAAYNLARGSSHRELLRRLDHAAIFLMIAGTYTPFMTNIPGSTEARGLLAAVWCVAIVGAAAKLLFPWRLERISILLYLLLGWAIVIALQPLMASMALTTVVLLAVGGVLYTAGVVFHVWEALPFNKAVWHGLVVAAAACHYCAVLYGVALAPAL
jgi:hemolysin III